MRKETTNWLTYILLSVAIGVAVVECSPQPSDKVQSENRCPYEPLECPNVQQFKRDYQLELLSDSTQIWDGDRLVSTIHYSASIDSVLLLDNQ